MNVVYKRINFVNQKELAYVWKASKLTLPHGQSYCYRDLEKQQYVASKKRAVVSQLF